MYTCPLVYWRCRSVSFLQRLTAPVNTHYVGDRVRVELTDHQTEELLHLGADPDHSVQALVIDPCTDPSQHTDRRWALTDTLASVHVKSCGVCQKRVLNSDTGEQRGLRSSKSELGLPSSVQSHNNTLLLQLQTIQAKHYKCALISSNIYILKTQNNKRCIIIPHKMQRK